MNKCLSACLSLLTVMQIHLLAATTLLLPQSNNLFIAEIHGHVSQQLIHNLYSDRTAEFDDIYLIQTPDKGRNVLIYCKPSHCYKLRASTTYA
ncbi:MAG: hypothetical protein P1U57_10175 [Oleibacter sp.]|nr:hypothetical protein [Thalassolituus sp.]